MLCLRCGGCCLHLDIFIVNPARIREDGSIDPTDPESMIFKPSGERCPHLSFEAAAEEDEEKIAACTIHHMPCYQTTPCQQFDQIGPADDVCIMKAYFETLEK